VRSVNWLGDAVMTTPALQRLRERFPRARITLLTQEALAELWERHPAVDAVITFSPTDNPWSVARRLRPHGFEVALVLPNSTRSALEAWLAGIPHRIGYSGHGRNWLLTRPLGYPSGLRPRRRRVGEVKRLVCSANTVLTATGGGAYMHQMRDYLHLAAGLGANPAPLAPRLEMGEDEVMAAVAAFSSRLRGFEASATDDQPLVYLGLNPSAAYGPAKRWPVERFAEVASIISKRVRNSVWLVFGGNADWDLCEQVTTFGAGRMVNLAGKTSLRQLMALLKTCRLLLTNDSGPMHVAAALGTPVVVLFGSTSPELTAPGQPGDPIHHFLRTKAACSPCFRRTCPIDFRCMTGIPAERAVTAILEILAAAPGTREQG
jgi:heptosyltransferase-2